VGVVGMTDDVFSNSVTLDNRTGIDCDAEVKIGLLGSMAAKNDSFLAFWPLDRVGVLC
jgi:hypothetical protein